MKVENICKFNPYRSSDLICENFIYEVGNGLEKDRVVEHHVIYLVISGEGEACVDGERYRLQSGTLFFTMKGERVSVVSQGELKLCYIAFQGRRADEYLERCGITKAQRSFCGHDELVPFWLECLQKARRENIDMISEAVLLYSISDFSALGKESDDVVTRMISITHDSFKDPSLSLSSVASLIGYDPKYLSTVFKKKRGISYTRFLREMRIKHAIFLMEEGVISVKNVALLSGFYDALYFSKVFTNEVGISPKAYIYKVSQEKGKADVDLPE